MVEGVFGRVRFEEIGSDERCAVYDEVYGEKRNLLGVGYG